MGTTHYFWDEIEDNVVEEYDDNGNTIVSYTTEPTLYGSVLTQDRGGEVRHYHFDGQGNTTELTNENGNVTDTRRYDAFGQVRQSSGATDCSYKYRGQHGAYTDQTTVYVRSRFYDELVGRWLSSDRAGFIDGPSLYRFLRNRPTLLTDPSGTVSVEPGARVLDGKCGDRLFAKWAFRLDTPKLCNGYVVQEVTVECGADFCRCFECPALVIKKTVYYEAWYVPAFSLYPLYYDEEGYTDVASSGANTGTCRIARQTGKIRFFCESTTGDLGRQGTNVHPAQVVVNSVSGKRWDVFRSYGASDCQTGAGPLPSTDRKPIWWDWDDSILPGINQGEAEGTRTFDFKGECCSFNDKYEAIAQP